MPDNIFTAPEDSSTPDDSQLIDRFGRQVTYVRISVTDRCDFRCVYCMSEDMSFVPRARVLTLEEIAEIAHAFVDLGVTKIRITGGEPLVRRNLMWLLERLGRLNRLHELTLTTNGSQLAKFAARLRDAGVSRLNISLDSLRSERFRQLTRTGDLETVLRGIQAAREAGFDRIRINSVLLKNRNHDEALDLVRFAIEQSLDIAFIEEMPLGDIGDHNRAEAYLSSDELKAELGRHLALLDTTEHSGGPARYFRVADTDTKIGFVSPHSHNFCASCNRVRLTTEGRLLLCLGQEHSVDLRQVIRSQPGNREALNQAIRASMAMKPKGHDFSLTGQPVILRHMSVTGG
jgi:cyclic pyranopterin phosphate synthase